MRARGNMNSWIWLGGCLLGWFGVELVQHHFFPGEPPWYRRWRGRTRCRENTAGDGPVSRTVPHNSHIFFEDLIPDFHEIEARITNHERAEVVPLLRKLCFESSNPISRSVYSILLAECALMDGNEMEARACLDDAWDLIEDVSHSETRRSRHLVIEKLYRFEAVLAYRKGQTAKAVHFLDEALQTVGFREWIGILNAEVNLLLGKTEACRSEVLRTRGWLTNHEERSDSPILAILQMIEAESYLRDGRMIEFWKSLRKLGTRSDLPASDRAAVESLQIEGLLSANNIAAAWRHVGTLYHLIKSFPEDKGLHRLFQLSCARIHLSEGNTLEAHRRLQLAENDSEYPVALWEVRFTLGMVLEAEGRLEEAAMVWQNLQSEAPGTYYAHVARSRISRCLAFLPETVQEPSETHITTP